MESNNDDLYNKASQLIDRTKTKSGKIIRATWSVFMLIALIAMTAVLTFATVEVSNPFSATFVINLIYIVVLCSVAMLVFIPNGENQEKSQNKPYQTNAVVWSQRSEDIRSQLTINQFRKFCKFKTEQFRYYKRMNYLYSANIDLAFYDKYLKSVPTKDLNQFKKPVYLKAEKEYFQLTQEQINNLKKFRGAIRSDEIIPERVLTGSTNDEEYAVAKNNMPYKDKILINRILSLVLYSSLVASTAIVPTGASGWIMWANLIVRIFSLIVWSFVGNYTGINQIKHDNQDIKDRIAFEDEFLENKEKFETEYEEIKAFSPFSIKVPQNKTKEVNKV